MIRTTEFVGCVETYMTDSVGRITICVVANGLTYRNGCDVGEECM